MNFENANRTKPYTRFQRKLDNLCEFPTLLEQFFSPYIKAAGYEPTFEWSAVERFYNDFQDTLSIRYALKIFCEFVLKLFLKFNCEQESLMRKIIYLYEELLVRRYDDFGTFCHDCERLECRKQYHLNSRPLLREVDEKRERILKDYNFNNPDSYCYRTPFPSYFIGNYAYNDYLLYQVKYGLIIIPNSENEACSRFWHLRYKCNKMRGLPGGPLYSQDLWFELLIATKIRNFRRLILIFDVMSNCTIIDGKYDHARRFGLYSLTLSEPAISQKEVQELLAFSFADDEAFKSYAFSSFKEMFADSPYLPSPRPLKHLCRCKIRDCLPRSPPMPTVLYQIELLPNCLKNYILILSD